MPCSVARIYSAIIPECPAGIMIIPSRKAPGLLVETLQDQPIPRPFSPVNTEHGRLTQKAPRKNRPPVRNSGTIGVDPEFEIYSGIIQEYHAGFCCFICMNPYTRHTQHIMPAYSRQTLISPSSYQLYAVRLYVCT